MRIAAAIGQVTCFVGALVLGIIAIARAGKYANVAMECKDEANTAFTCNPM